MRHRAGELNMAHSLTSHRGKRDLDTAFFAHHAPMLKTLVLAAQALIVLHRPEQLGTEQAVSLGLEGAVVDGLRLFHLAEGP